MRHTDRTSPESGHSRKGKLILFIPVLIVLFPVGLVLAEGSAAAQIAKELQRDIPAIKKDCGICHPGRDGDAPGLLVKPVTELCLGCHPDRSGDSEHRVDVFPAGTVTQLPLTGGRMTCATCHDPHANRHGSMLRMPATELCRACHRK